VSPAPAPLPPPAAPAGRLTNDPVRWTWVITTFLFSVVTVLLLAGVVTEVIGGIIVGILTALYTAVSALFVGPNTVALAPLNELAAASEPRPPEVP
jgi:hypothetical protein